MKELVFAFLSLILICSSCMQDDDIIVDDPVDDEQMGYHMLLIGNSFFKPYAEKIDGLAIEAGFVDHSSTRITRGGENGRPINFWNDSLTVEHQEIKQALDQGDVDIFGMTAGHDPEDRIAGHRAWIDYALQSNPDIDIFIAIPQIDFPEAWDSLAQVNGYESIIEFYDFAVNSIVHDSMVDQLRLEFPNTNIFTIPTGWASFELALMKQNGELLDDIAYFGPEESSLFTDPKGHQGQIIKEAGSLVWLSSLYDVDLSTNTHETGFNTDLHAVAQDVVDNHDPEYKK